MKNAKISKGNVIGMQMNIRLVDNCNIRCKMCEFVKHITGAEMPIAQYEGILCQLKDVRLRGQAFDRIRLDGNREALLYGRLGEAVKIAKRMKFFVGIVTNGLLMSAERATEMLELGLDYVEFSVTGVDAEVYSEFQGYGKSAEAAKRQLDTVIENITGIGAV
jgi:MoaA/NifB/PqqE/SkfB family radical SAM enzyme